VDAKSLFLGSFGPERQEAGELEPAYMHLDVKAALECVVTAGVGLEASYSVGFLRLAAISSRYPIAAAVRAAASRSPFRACSMTWRARAWRRS
jgi:hypothetical protein